jgi:hypothetical protein
MAPDTTQLADLGVRIRKAEADRDRWRATGNHDRYLESYFLVEALELQINRLREPPHPGIRRY